MIILRSILFNLWLWLSMPLFAVGLSPALLMPHRYAMAVIRLWAHTVLFGLRWLAAMGEICCDRERSAMAVADAALAVCPDSGFVIRDFKPWARDRLREAALRGNVYRMEQAA